MLVLTPAYASIVIYTSNKMNTSQGDAIEKPITDKLFLAFHGDQANPDLMSYVRIFCAVTGPFEAFLARGYMKTTQEAVIESLPSPTRSQLWLNLS